jgi:tetratricopeptide (TPR) repeat protein
MKKILQLSSVLFIVILFSFNISFAQTIDDLLNQGDQYITDFNVQKAFETYQQADKLSPNNWEVYWRLSRVYVYQADEMPNNTGDQEDAQLAVYQKAYDYADKAVKLAPDKSITYLRRAIANGKIALFKGVFSVAGVVNAVKSDCEKAIGLGTGGSYVQALSHYILARTNAKVSEKWAPARAILGLGWADIDVAINEYNIAIKLYPKFRMFYLDLAKAYIREDEFSKAKENLNDVISSPKRDVNDDAVLAEAKKLYEEIKNE